NPRHPPSLSLLRYRPLRDLPSFPTRRSSDLGGAAVAWPLAAKAQQPKSPIRIGFLPLGSSSNTYDQSLVSAFRQGEILSGLGSRSEEHTSELQSRENLVCRLLLEKKK